MFQEYDPMIVLREQENGLYSEHLFLQQSRISYEVEVADWDLDRKLDLVAIKKSGTANGKAEVHISSGVSNFQQYLLNTATIQTAESPDSYDFELADW